MLFMVGQLVVVLWSHANINYDIIFTDCSQNVLSGLRASSRHRQVDYHLSTHWGRVTHICVSKLTIIDWDNGLSPERRQATIWTNAGILLIGPLGTNFSEILIEIQTLSLKKIRLKMSFAKCCSSPLGLNVLIIGSNSRCVHWPTKNCILSCHITSDGSVICVWDYFVAFLLNFIHWYRISS